MLSDEVEVLSAISKMVGPGGTGGSLGAVRTLATLLVAVLALQEAHAVIEERGEARFSPLENAFYFCFFPSFFSVLSLVFVSDGKGGLSGNAEPVF